MKIKTFLMTTAVACLLSGGAMACGGFLEPACGPDTVINSQGGAGGQGGNASAGAFAGAAAGAEAKNYTDVDVSTRAYGGDAKAYGGSARQDQDQGQIQGQKQDASNSNSISIDGDDNKNVSISAPALAAGANPCAVSASAGGGAAGFGLTIGGAWSSESCDLRAKMATLAGLGLVDEAIKLGCQDDDMRVALGSKCAGSAPTSATERNLIASGTGPEGDAGTSSVEDLGLLADSRTRHKD